MRLLNYYTCSLSHFSRLRGFGRVSVSCFREARFSTDASVSSGCVDEAFSIPIGNNGLVSLKVTRPPAASQFIKGQSQPQGLNVILYLPPGPLFQDTNEAQFESHSSFLPTTWGTAFPTASGSSPQHQLASLTAATVVTINYRLGLVEEHFPSAAVSPEPDQVTSEEPAFNDQIVPRPTFYQYPTPVHDTLAGFDWVQDNLQPTQLGIVGSHIGGSLALMLALTEAQSVRAVATLEPVCDWPGIDEYCVTEDTTMGLAGDGKSANAGMENQKRKHQSKKKASAPTDLVPLLKAREKFFASPEQTFDAFASPILFLRSAGRDCPRKFPQYLTGPEYPVPVIKPPNKTTTAAQHAAPPGSMWDHDVYPLPKSDLLESEDEMDVSDTSTGPVVRRRKAVSRWPPFGLDYGLSGRTWSGPGHGVARLQMTLPWVRIFLREQISNLPASSGKSTKSKETSTEDTVLARQADEMVSVMRRACFWGQEKGVGERKVTLSQLSTGGDADRSNMPGNEIGSWLKRAFDGSIEEEG